jgi:hypothetical protein
MIKTIKFDVKEIKFFSTSNYWKGMHCWVIVRNPYENYSNRKNLNITLKHWLHLKWKSLEFSWILYWKILTLLKRKNDERVIFAFKERTPDHWSLTELVFYNFSLQNTGLAKSLISKLKKNLIAIFKSFKHLFKKLN